MAVEVRNISIQSFNLQHDTWINSQQESREGKMAGKEERSTRRVREWW